MWHGINNKNINSLSIRDGTVLGSGLGVQVFVPQYPMWKTSVLGKL